MDWVVFISHTNYWILFPWSYPIMSLYIDSIEPKQLYIILIVYLLSLLSCIFIIKNQGNGIKVKIRRVVLLIIKRVVVAIR